MKQNRQQENRPKQEHPVRRLVLTLAVPVLALVLAAAFIIISIRYGAVRRSVTIELGEQTPEATAFLRRDTGEAAYETAPEPIYREPGNYRMKVIANGRSVPVILRVRDTQAPTADGPEQTVPAGTKLKPDSLIRDLRDKGLVRVTYEAEPDYFTIGDYEAVVLLEDASGNATRISVPVHVRTAADEITLEAGSPVPKAEDLLIGAYRDVRMTPVTEEMMRTPGEYVIRITADGMESETRLLVRDTIPPTGRGVTRIVKPGTAVTPDMLTADVSDETAVETAFVTQPDPDSLDPQTIQLTLTDRGGNVATVYATLLFSNAVPIGIEARGTGVAISELLEEGTYTEASLDMIYIPDDPGQHVLAVTVDGKRNLALIDVRDTTPPTITVTRSQWYLDTPTAAENLGAADDVTETVLTYLREPDWPKETQQVTFVATDTSGNRGEQTFTLTLTPDAEPPEIYGVRDRWCYVGEPVAYLAEIFAWDDCDGDVAVEVDASEVDASRMGSYSVTYSATDRSGNTATKTALIRIVTSKVEEDRAQEVADEILSKIFTDGMTLAEQIEAIYDYVFKNVHYVATSNKQDWRSEAVRGLTTGKGDCFTSYASARLLLEQTDAQIMSVQRMDTLTHHYWLLVNIGTGWYHFDACRTGVARKRCFMWTDAQTERLSQRYWRYDKTLYPPVATERYDGGN